MIKYDSDLNLLSKLDLEGFFEGWPNPPSIDTFTQILHGSYRVVYAHDESKMIGFITGISDGVLSAYIPLLEVLPEYRGQGIGKKLFELMRRQLDDLYMIDLTCDEHVVPFYSKLGLSKMHGMGLRNYDRHSV